MISPNFLVWKYEDYTETVPFYKISTPGNKVKLCIFRSGSRQGKQLNTGLRNFFKKYRECIKQI